MEGFTIPTVSPRPSRPTRRSSLLGWPKVNTFLSFSVGRLAEEALPERKLVQKSGRDLKKTKNPSKTPRIPTIITLNAHEDWIHHNLDNDDDDLYQMIQKEQQEDETTTSTTSSRSKVIQPQSTNPMMRSPETERTQHGNSNVTKTTIGTEERILLNTSHHVQQMEVEESQTGPVNRTTESKSTHSDCTATNEVAEAFLMNKIDRLQLANSVDKLEVPAIRRPRAKKSSAYAEMAKEHQEKMEAKNLKRSASLLQSR
jgi:hypothetical protein